MYRLAKAGETVSVHLKLEVCQGVHTTTVHERNVCVLKK